MKKRMIITTAAVLAMTLSSCKPDPEVVMPIEQADTTEYDSTPEFVDTIASYDTTAFVERDLEAEFQALVNEKLQSVYFEYNSYELSAESQTTLAVAAEFLKSEVARTVRLKITGHTDERGTTEYNIALGEKRALAVRNYLSDYGVNTSRLEVTSLGKEVPETRGCDTDYCHNRNRRAAFTVIR